MPSLWRPPRWHDARHGGDFALKEHRPSDQNQERAPRRIFDEPRVARRRRRRRRRHSPRRAGRGGRRRSPPAAAPSRAPTAPTASRRGGVLLTPRGPVGRRRRLRALRGATLDVATTTSAPSARRARGGAAATAPSRAARPTTSPPSRGSSGRTTRAEPASSAEPAPSGAHECGEWWRCGVAQYEVCTRVDDGHSRQRRARFDGDREILCVVSSGEAVAIGVTVVTVVVEASLSSGQAQHRRGTVVPRRAAVGEVGAAARAV